jgi:hypothetical protein
MKKILLFSIIAVFLASSISYAQDKNRPITIGMEKYRDIIENYAPLQSPTDNSRDAGVVVLFENFDNTGGQLPAGWTSGGSSTSCKWAVDASPNPPGYYSSGYSLNYNNGVDFNCGYNWGWVMSPLIVTAGADIDVSFWYNASNECGGGACYYDRTYLMILDENLNVLYSVQLNGYTSWNKHTYLFNNTSNVNKIYVYFYFDTLDSILNGYYGPFIDDLEVRSLEAIPVSGWALAIGITLIAAFTLLRFRKLG